MAVTGSGTEAGITKDGEGQIALSGLTTISYGGFLNGESFQQDGIVTFSGYQYAASWNNATTRRAVLARRKLPNGGWEKCEFSNHALAARDAHNTINATPMAMTSTGLHVWTIGKNRGLINQEHMAVDSVGRVHVLLSHMPDTQADDTTFGSARSKSQFFHCFRDTVASAPSRAPNRGVASNHPPWLAESCLRSAILTCRRS